MELICEGLFSALVDGRCSAAHLAAHISDVQSLLLPSSSLFRFPDGRSSPLPPSDLFRFSFLTSSLGKRSNQTFRTFCLLFPCLMGWTQVGPSASRSRRFCAVT